MDKSFDHFALCRQGTYDYSIPNIFSNVKFNYRVEKTNYDFKFNNFKPKVSNQLSKINQVKFIKLTKYSN